MRSYQQFFAELKRRKVFRVAAVYGAVAFALIQLADPLAQAMRLPDTFLPFVVAILLLGFPVALVLAWAFEVTPDGVQKTGAAAPGEIEGIVAQPAAQRWPAGLLALAGAALLLGGTWWAGLQAGRSADDATETAGRADSVRLAYGDPMDDQRPSIAVLPFDDLSREGDQSYFSDGMTEEIANTLAGIPELVIKGRTSAFQLADSRSTPQQMGDELGVGYLLAGSVRKEGDLLRISAQLIDAETGSQIWSDQYDRLLESVFAIQTEIAEAVAAALRVPLGLEPEESLVHPTADLAAYDLYLAARSRMRERGTSLLEAKELLEAALARDSNWAPAWAALAEVEEIRVWYPSSQPDEVSQAEFTPGALAAAERAARRALELDPRSASALVALGSVHRNQAEWDDAEAAYLQALELDPDNAEAHQQYGDYLVSVGRIAEGVHAMDRAAVLDASPIRLGMLATVLLEDGRYAESAEAYEKAIERATTLEGRQRALRRGSYRYALLGRWEDAIEAVNLSNRLDPDADPWIGSPAEVEAFFSGLRDQDLAQIPGGAFDDMHAGFWMMAGQPDSAMVSLLDYASTQPFGRTLEFRNAALAPLESDPRFQAYLEERGLGGAAVQRTPVAERTRPRALGPAAP